MLLKNPEHAPDPTNIYPKYKVNLLQFSITHFSQKDSILLPSQTVRKTGRTGQKQNGVHLGVNQQAFQPRKNRPNPEK
jgi:hypothetical protein